MNQTKLKLEHDEDCPKSKVIDSNKNIIPTRNGIFTIGCIACIYDFVDDTLLALTKEVAELQGKLSPEVKQIYMDKLIFLKNLRNSLP